VNINTENLAVKRSLKLLKTLDGYPNDKRFFDNI